MDKNSSSYSLGELADQLGLTLEGDPDQVITGIATLVSAGEEDLSFYHNKKFHTDLTNTNASAVILTEEASADCPANKLLANNPYAAFARATQLFQTGSAAADGIHESASIDSTASVGEGVSIGANVVIDAYAVVGANCTIGANTVIGAESSIGKDSLLYPNVTIYPGVNCGSNAIIHSQVVIGSDGFGFARDGDKQVKIAQLGGVQIGRDVEIGAGTTIDRGALEDTIIGDGVKIDNQVQIAHNVRVGDNTVICGCSAIAGSSTIGKNCIIAGGVGIINHITIVDNVTVTAMSLVNRSIREKGIYSSGTGLSETAKWKKNIVHFTQLDAFNHRLKSLEKTNNK